MHEGTVTAPWPTGKLVQEWVYSVGTGCNQRGAVPGQASCAGSARPQPGRSHGGNGSGRSHGCCGRCGHRGWAVPGTRLCLEKNGRGSELHKGHGAHLAQAGQGRGWRGHGAGWGQLMKLGHEGVSNACTHAAVVLPLLVPKAVRWQMPPHSQETASLCPGQHGCTWQWPASECHGLLAPLPAGTHPGTGWQRDQEGGSPGGSGRRMPRGCWCRAGCSCASPGHTRRCLVVEKRVAWGYSTWQEGSTAPPLPCEHGCLLYPIPSRAAHLAVLLVLGSGMGMGRAARGHCALSSYLLAPGHGELGGC